MGRNDGIILLLVVFFVAGFAFGAWWASVATGNLHRTEAVNAGHAEYYLDGNTAKWRWLPHGDRATSGTEVQ